MSDAYPSEVVRVVCAVLTPFIAMFGIYVIAHGHYGPGGGFAGGVIAAVGAVLPRLTLGERLAHQSVPAVAGPLAGGIGMLLFILCGVVPMLLGGAFLDYSALALGGMDPAYARYLGILVVEIGVGAAVFGAMVLIFDVLVGRAD
jgi:multicomponent Na+:H+ antiporter subunit B